MAEALGTAEWRIIHKVFTFLRNSPEVIEPIDSKKLGFLGSTLDGYKSVFYATHGCHNAYYVAFWYHAT